MVAFQFYAVLLLAVSAGCRSDVLHSTAASLSRQLWDIFTNVSGTSVLHLEELLANQNAEPVNGTTIAQQAADDISSRLATVREVLHETAAAAEGLYSRHQNQTCCDRACQYGTGYDTDHCSLFCNVSSISYVSTGRQFGIETGENGTRQCVMGALEDDADSCSAVEHGMGMRESAVHIPRDMHEDDPAVLCFVQWTDPLIEQFSANFSLHDNSTIILQYVGSDTRLLRFTPPSDWLSLSQCERCPLTLQDTYELGRRPWYTNTVTGEKYIVILLDVSGSMAGFQSILARTTITELLKALTANDYFQIFQVGEGERSRPFRCFPNKTRATPENVLVMNHVLQSLPDLNNIGRAQFSSPLTTALTLLGNSTVCHRVLIIFTDGERETELPFDLIRAYNEHKEIQVFTFLVGYGGDHANLETVACQNRGRMGRIKEYSDIIPAVLLITNSLEQPPPSPKVHYTSYRGVYGNLALTMGQPLWISDEIGNKSDSIGVVAVDLSHDALLETALRNHSIGASGYGFIVDNNGQLVNHPLISMEYLQGLSDDNLLSLDMDYYEHPLNKSQWLAVRRGILGGGWGHHSLLTWSTLEREEVYVLRNTTYSYAPINGTPYILVIVTPSDLWLVAPPTSPNGSSVFTLFSSEPECQCTEENCQQYLKRVEGRPLTALSVVAAGGCGNESTALLKPLQLTAGQVVGVAGTTLSPGIMDQLLTNALREGGWGEEEVGEEGGWEVYVIDETANIVAAAPYQQRGWFPGLYPAVQARLVANAVFRNDSIHGYELRPSQGAGEADCECESLELYLKAIEVYQLSGPAPPVEPEEMACGDNGTLTLKVRATSIPNTTLTLVALSGPSHCLHGNKTDCSQRPIGFQCVPCVCGCQSCDLHRQNISCFCPPTKNVILCATIRPHPSLLVVMAMSFITTMAWQSSWR